MTGSDHNKHLCKCCCTFDTIFFSTASLLLIVTVPYIFCHLKTTYCLIKWNRCSLKSWNLSFFKYFFFMQTLIVDERLLYDLPITGMCIIMSSFTSPGIFSSPFYTFFTLHRCFFQLIFASVPCESIEASSELWKLRCMDEMTSLPASDWMFSSLMRSACPGTDTRNMQQCWRYSFAYGVKLSLLHHALFYKAIISVN